MIAGSWAAIQGVWDGIGELSDILKNPEAFVKDAPAVAAWQVPLHLPNGLALSLLACSSLFAAEKTLRIGIEAAYPPFASPARRGSCDHRCGR